MNKHTLNYHTRLHEWYRQHNLLQEKQNLHINDNLAPPVMEGIENLTNDKLHFIIDWCSDVNSTFFNAASKEAKSTVGFYKQSKSPSPKGRSKLTNPQPVYSSEVFKQADQRHTQQKTFVNRGNLPTPRINKFHNIIYGGQKKGNIAATKKPGRTTKTVTPLDLCIRNSKVDVMKTRDMSRVSRDSSNLGDNEKILKQNGSRLSGQIVNSTENVSQILKQNGSRLSRQIVNSTENVSQILKQNGSRLSRQIVNSTENVSQILKQNGSRLSRQIVNSTENASSKRRSRLKQNYRITSVMANLRNETRGGHGYTTSVMTKENYEKYSQTAQKQGKIKAELTKSGGLLSNELHTISTIHVQESKIDNDSKDKVEKVRTSHLEADTVHNVENAISISSSTCQSICSDDKQLLATTTQNGSAIDPINTENCQNIDTKPKLNVITEYVEEKTSEIIKENCPNEKVAIAPNKSIPMKSSVEKAVDYNTNGYSSRHNGMSQTVCATSSCHSNLNDHYKCIDKVDQCDSYDNAKTSGPDKISYNKREETKNENDLNTHNKKMVIIKDSKEHQPENIKNHCESINEMLSSSKHSVASQDRELGDASFSATLAPTISNISLSNNLLNVLSIDDCKISMRYDLHKINVRVYPEGQDNAQIQLGFIHSKNQPSKEDGEIHNREANGTILETQSVSSVVPHTASYELAGNKRRCFIQTASLHFLRKKGSNSASIEKSFNKLMHSNTIKQPNGFIKSKIRKNASDNNCDKEGPGYRRLRAALRVHMKEVQQNHYTKILTRYKSLADG